MERTASFKDRKGLLIFFGIILLLTGGISLLFSVLSLFTIALQQTTVPADQQIPFGTVLFAVLIYVAIGAVFISLGIGSIQAKRWARSLTLLLSWLVLISGAITLVFMIFYAGNLFDQIGAITQEDPMVLEIVLAITYVFITVILIIIPGIFILVYRSKSVMKTVQKYDPELSWTEKCPLPLMAHSFFLLYIAFVPLFLIGYGFFAPFFGTFLSGWPAALLWCANSIICIYLAIEVYRLNIRAWHYSLYLFFLWTISAFVTFMYHDYWDIYQYMNIPSESIALMQELDYFSRGNILILLVLTFVSYLIFYFYAKKYFKKIEG